MSGPKQDGADTGARARLGAAAIGLGGLAFGVIQILQGTVSAFDPRPIVAVLCAVAVGLAGLTAERLRHFSARRRRVATAVRLWPPRTMCETDPLALGVFPDGADRAYVRRKEDGQLDEALQGGGMTVVTGPARSGKSRAATEAARRVWSDRPVVIPADGHGLSELIADPGSLATDAIWWLDDLERFRDQLDGPALAALTDPRRTVVVTVRDDAWAALLQASGEDGERGRRLLAAAAVVELASGPPVAGATDAVRDGSRPPRGRRRPDPVFVVALAATATAVVMLALAVARDGFSRSKPPPISAQVADIRAQAARGDRRVLYTVATRGLHGTDDRSQVFILHSDSRGSDELRIYDEVDGRLQLRFAYRPRTSGRPPPISNFIPLREQQDRAPLDYIAVEPPVAVDVDRDGAREVVFSYRAWVHQGLPPFRLPLAVAWDDRSEAYAISGVLSESIADTLPRGKLVIGGGFRRRFRLVNALAPGHGPLIDHAVSSMIILDDGLLVTATQIGFPTYVKGLLTVKVAINVFRLSTSRGQVTAQRLCASRAGPLITEIPRPLSANFRFALRARAARLRRMSEVLSASGPQCFS